MQILISIIVPVYNSERFIKKCLDSILTQSYKYFELIIVDDGSTDRSFSICQEYSERDDRIKLFRQRNLGVSAARNYALDKAVGDYVMFVDSDDELLEDAILLLLPSKQHANYELIVSGLSYTILDKNNDKEISPTSATITLRDLLKNYNLYRHFLEGPVAKLYDFNVIKENNVRFNIDYTLGEDQLFIADFLFYCHIIKFIGRPTYRVHIHNSGTLSSSTDFSRHPDIDFTIAELRFRLYKRCGLEDQCNEFQYIVYRTYISYCMQIVDKRYCLPFHKQLDYFNKFCKDYEIKKNIHKYRASTFRYKLFKISYLTRCGFILWTISKVNNFLSYYIKKIQLGLHKIKQI